METNTKHKHKFCELLEFASDEQMYLIFVSCMSADTLINQEACEHSLHIVEEIISALNEANISDIKRNSWLGYAEKSKKIISQDLENFKKQTNGE